MKQFLLAFDQLINTIVFIKGDGWGFSDETLSARAWRVRDISTIPYRFVNVLFFWQANHCRGAYNDEMDRKHMPTEYQYTPVLQGA